jgi:hypothetical protein
MRFISTGVDQSWARYYVSDRPAPGIKAVQQAALERAASPGHAQFTCLHSDPLLPWLLLTYDHPMPRAFSRSIKWALEVLPLHIHLHASILGPNLAAHTPSRAAQRIGH